MLIFLSIFTALVPDFPDFPAQRFIFHVPTSPQRLQSHFLLPPFSIPEVAQAQLLLSANQTGNWFFNLERI
jgi:hypothetical protein